MLLATNLRFAAGDRLDSLRLVGPDKARWDLEVEQRVRGLS